MDSYFFRVEHELLRSPAFQALGGSAIKVYLVIGLHSDFGTGWAYPSIRTIARQAGLSRQTVLAAIKELASSGLLAMSKSPGRSTAYKVLRAPEREGQGGSASKGVRKPAKGGPISLEVTPETGLNSLGVTRSSGPNSLQDPYQNLDTCGPASGPKQEPGTREESDSTSTPIPGTPFRLTAGGRLLVSVDLQELLTQQGISRRLAERLVGQKDPEAVAKVLLNASYLQSQGKLQNGPGYIRAGLEAGYELLPQVATRLETRRKELQDQLRQLEQKKQESERQRQRDLEEEAVAIMLEELAPEELQSLIEQAVALLPAPLVKRNPTLSNPFVRARVYELAGGDALN